MVVGRIGRSLGHRCGVIGVDHLSDDAISEKPFNGLFAVPDSRNAAARDQAVLVELHEVPSAIIGKQTTRVDDSLVRGMTSGELVKLVGDAGSQRWV